jgi:N-methylhydantoinase A
LRQQAKTKLSNALIGEREVWFDGKFVASKIYDRSLLCPGTQVEGPAVIEQFDSTVPIPAKVVARIDEYSNIIEK